MTNLKRILVVIAGFYCWPVFSQLGINAHINHIEPDGIDSLGDIILQPYGGTPPYHYAWDQGIYPGNKDRIGVQGGFYSATVEDATANNQTFSFNLLYKMKWQAFKNAFSRQDSLSLVNNKSAGYVASSNMLPANADGYVELLVRPVDQPYLLGFTQHDPNDAMKNVNDIDFGFYVTEDNDLYVYESKTFIYLESLDNGSIIRLERTGSSFKLSSGETNYTMSAPRNKWFTLAAQFGANMLMDAGCSFWYQYSYDDFQAYGVLTHLSTDELLDDGKIALHISGGQAPYTITWPEQEGKIFASGLAKGPHTAVVTDSRDNSLSYTYDIGYRPDWEFLNGVTLRNDSLVIDSNYTVRPSAVSANILKANSGWTEFVIAPYTAPYLVGFIENSSASASGDLDNIYYGVYVGEDNILYAYSSYEGFSYIDDAEVGDVIRLSRDGSNVFIKRNDDYSDARYSFVSAVDSRIKIQLGGNMHDGIGASFNKPLQLSYDKTNPSEEDPASGSIYVEPKYGVKPYTYAWSNSSTENMLTGLSAGTYDVTVSDAAGATLSQSFRLGYSAAWTHLDNLNANSNGNYVQLDKQAPASAFTNKYIGGGQNGYFEFNVLNATSNFNFILRPYNTETGLGNPAPVIVKQSVIKMAIDDLPARNSDAWRRINLVDSLQESDSLDVIQKEFVSYPCNGCSRENLSGIQVDYGRMYALNNGVTIQKGIVVHDNDLISLKSVGGDVGVQQNGVTISLSNFGHLVSGTAPYIGNINTTGLPPYGELVHVAIDHVTSGSLNLGNPIVGNVDTDIPNNHVTEGCSMCSIDATINSKQVTLYNDLGTAISMTKEYYDYRGEVKQTQAMNFTDKKIIATQPLYDAYGRKVAQSLPAPIDASCFCYVSDFIFSSHSGVSYLYYDFDMPDHHANNSQLTAGEVDKPIAVSAQAAYKLGWYYSNNNTWENYVPVATTPYSRVQYSSVDASSVVKVSKPGDQLNSGSGHETFNFKMITSGELNTVFGAGLGWRINNFSNFASSDACVDVINPLPLVNTAPLSMKSISVDENGIENITFMDLTGNVIATCMAGRVNGADISRQTVMSRLMFGDETQRYVDVHLPGGCENSLIISAPVNANSPGSSGHAIYNIVDLKTGEYVQNPATSSGDWYSTINSSIQPVLPAGYYRVFAKSLPPVYAQGSGWVEISYDINYYNYALNYYDYANRLKAVVPPEGLAQGGHRAAAGYGTIQRQVYAVSSGDNSPSYFPAGRTWSTGESNFENKIALSLPEQTDENEAISLKVTFYNKAAAANARTINPNTTTGDYDAGKEVLDTGKINSIPDTIAVTHSQNVRFKVKVGLMDATDIIIDATIHESTDLVCHVQYDKNNTRYLDWEPATFRFVKQSKLSDSRAWSKLKIIALEPVDAVQAPPDLTAELAGQLVVTINTLRLSADAAPAKTRSVRYRYNSWSNMICTVSPDNGRNDMIYTQDGRPKYSRDARQYASNTSPYYRKYSFVSADALGRPVYSGENNPATQTSGAKVYFRTYEDEYLNQSYGTAPGGAVSALTYGTSDLFDPNNWPGGTSELVEMHYDLPDPNFWSENLSPASGLSPVVYVQRHLAGRLSYSKNSNKKTWYSYDEYGRTEWVVQKYTGVNPSGGSLVKTFQYKYDYSGNVGEVVYNAENATDCLHHFYEYDQDNRLKRVYTQRPPVAPATTGPKALQAAYAYYMHGPLKRVELGTQLQGIDYVYTINGWLKSMNSAEMEGNRDPGLDGGYLGNGVPHADLFGMALEYYKQDYERSNTNIQTFEEVPATANFAPDQFNGIIKGQRWQTRTPASAASGLSYANQQLMYGYQYDKKYQLADARFGPVYHNADDNNNVLRSSFNVSSIPDYRVYNLSYDNNGNILSLKRDAYNPYSANFHVDDLAYSYNTCSNRLVKVTDGVTSNTYGSFDFKSGQANNNYIYDEIGELTSDASNDKKYEYNAFGNIVRIRKMNNDLVAEYDYDEAGYRVQKTAYLSSASQKRTLYVRDAGGNIMATYEKTANGNITSYGSPSEWDIYAADRIGIIDNTGGAETCIYELADHLGNVRATFKPEAKTNIATNFDTHTSGNDEGWFNNSNNTLTNAFDYNTNPTITNYFVRTQKTMAAEYGAGSRLIPVKYGNSLTLTWKALWESGGLPDAGMEIKLTDAAGNPIGGSGGLQYVPMVSPGALNNWHSYSEAITIMANYPDMYLSFYPHNRDNSGKVAFFDDFNLTFNSGSAFEPALLNMADYYPHGSVMPGLNYNSSYKYRYGYQGQFAEKDDESNESFFELRNYDPLLGRFKTTDPYGQYWSPYMAMGNSHPNIVDGTGGEGEDWFYNFETDEYEWFEGKGPGTKVEGYAWFSADRRIIRENLPETEVIFNRGASTSVSDGDFNLTVNSLAQSGGGTWDKATNDRISQLDSRVQRPATQFVNEVESQLGIQLRVVQGYRSIEEQNALYAKGRTTPGPIVTKAKGGQSFHNYGLAIDVVIMKNGQPVWDQIPQSVSNIGIGLGFEWGGNWRSFKDYPHFEMTFGQTLDQLRRK